MKRYMTVRYDSDDGSPAVGKDFVALVVAFREQKLLRKITVVHPAAMTAIATGHIHGARDRRE